jgi:uncharacterized membrane protein YsdA (DUF1294 family)
MPLQPDKDDPGLSPKDFTRSFHDGVHFVVAAMVLSLNLALIAFLFGVFRKFSGGEIVLAMYGFANALSFVAMALDKFKARFRMWRLSEASLHILEAMGGFGGSFLAQQLFRHKVSKASYQLVYWSIVLIHVACWLWWFGMGAEWMEEIRQRRSTTL